MARLEVYQDDDIIFNEMTLMQLANLESLVKHYEDSKIENDYKIAITIYATVTIGPMNTQLIRVDVDVEATCDDTSLEYSFYAGDFEVFSIGLYPDNDRSDLGTFSRMEFNVMVKMLQIFDSWVPRYIGINEFRKAIKEEKEGKETNELQLL